MSEDPSHTSTPLSASGTVEAGSNLEQAIELACKGLKRNFYPEDEDDEIKRNMINAWNFVYVAISQAGSPELKERLRNRDEFGAYVRPGDEEEQELLELLRSMAKEQVPWKKLFENEAFLKPEPDETADPDTALATKVAWGGEYKGDLAGVLCETIADYLSKDRTPYARLSTIVNSSGTGKSRVVDELGTHIITVPMCLRQVRREGFPPADADLRDWLVSDSGDYATVRRRMRGFVYSLLMVTREQLQVIEKEQAIPELPHLEILDKSSVVKRQENLASAFREHLTYTPNSNRRTFYERVTAKAKQFVEKCHFLEKSKTFPHGRYFMKIDDETEYPEKAGEMLCRFIDEHHYLDSVKGPRRPLVVLAFDEADALTDNPPDQKNWNLFSELRRVLRQINDLPIFSLFLSTAGRFNKFSPNAHSDPSARAREPDYRSLNPITEISFDDIAYRASEGTITIDKVVSIDWISHLGRPLFGSYWDNLPQRRKSESTMLDYAKQKLLDGPTELRGGNWAGSLACLSTRFALEFNLDGTAHDVTYAQVERHMRLCIAATVGLEKLITISGSEPLLAEAAYGLMKNSDMSAVRHLAGHVDLNCIDRGRRGELVATLLIMQAYDAARESSITSNRRWVSVANFMEALLPPLEYNTLLQSAPTSWPINHHNQGTFETIFQDYGMWFNHVIKIEDKEMISIDHLWKFVVRGAMILCATNQEGIDIILPVFRITQNLGPDSVTAIIIQVKNGKDYKAKLRGNLFDAMDSVVKSAIFPQFRVDCGPAEPKKKKRKTMTKPKNEVARKPKPVIRMVFALASPEAAVVFRVRPVSHHYNDGFTTFDIWLAGLSDNTFKQIQDVDIEPYKTLLERSLTPHDAFKVEDVLYIGERARELRGARRRKIAPLTFTRGDHHLIHPVQGKTQITREKGPQASQRHGVAMHPATPDPQSSTTAGPSTIPS